MHAEELMHMADALLSPAVGGGMWAVSAGAIAWGSARLGREGDDRIAPLMGVLGGFLFAAQMINFSIPGTGSSGHLTGGLLLAILLGPGAAFLTVASVLFVQALFFADGGLLALGCNIFNLGAVPAFLVYQLIYRRLIGTEPGGRREAVVTLFASITAMQLGALCVVLETALSGVSELPLGKFLALMLPIHVAIGTVEGVVTLAVVSFVRKARPELLARRDGAANAPSSKPLLAAVLVCALLVAGGVSRFASEKPDGLEWSIAGAADSAPRSQHANGVTASLQVLQERFALFPDYRLPGGDAAAGKASTPQTGSSAAGVVGTGITLVIVIAVAALLRRGKRGGTAPEA